MSMLPLRWTRIDKGGEAAPPEGGECGPESGEASRRSIAFGGEERALLGGGERDWPPPNIMASTKAHASAVCGTDTFNPEEPSISDQKQQESNVVTWSLN